MAISLITSLYRSEKHLPQYIKRVQAVAAQIDFPLEIGIYLENQPLPSIEKVQINKKSQKASIPVTAKPFKIILDPNTNLLYEGGLVNWFLKKYWHFR